VVDECAVTAVISCVEGSGRRHSRRARRSAARCSLRVHLPVPPHAMLLGREKGGDRLVDATEIGFDLQQSRRRDDVPDVV